VCVLRVNRLYPLQLLALGPCALSEGSFCCFDSYTLTEQISEVVRPAFAYQTPASPSSTMSASTEILIQEDSVFYLKIKKEGRAREVLKCSLLSLKFS